MAFDNEKRIGKTLRMRAVVGGIYPNQSERFGYLPLKGLIKTIKTDASRSAGYIARIGEENECR